MQSCRVFFLEKETEAPAKQMWLWLRRLVRKHSSEIPLTTAEKWNFRLSLLYGFLVWNATGLILYKTLSAKDKWAEMKNEMEAIPPSEQFARVLGIKQAHIVQVSGFKKVNEYDINNTSEENESD